MAEISRTEKMEAIIDISKYDQKLVKAFGILAEELLSGRTDIHSVEFGQIMQGINWTVEVLKRVMDVILEEPEQLDIVSINDALTAFHHAYEQEDTVQLAAILRDKMVPAFQQICELGTRYQA